MISFKYDLLEKIEWAVESCVDSKRARNKKIV